MQGRRLRLARMIWWGLIVLILSACDFSQAPPVPTYIPLTGGTWIDRPLDGEVIVDQSKPVPIIGHVSGVSSGQAKLLVKRNGQAVDPVPLSTFPEREGLVRAEGEWTPPGPGNYELQIDGGGHSPSISVSVVIVEPTATVTPTDTATATPTATATLTPSTTPTATPTFTSTSTSTQTSTPTSTLTSTPTLTNTTTPTPTPTMTPSWTPTSTPTLEPTFTPSLTQTPTPTPSPTTAGCFVYVSGQSNQLQANVRTGPGTIYPILGTITAKDGEFKVTGQYTDNNGNLWWQIEYKNQNNQTLVGFVSDGFVSKDGTCDQSIPTVTAPPPPRPTRTPTKPPPPPSTACVIQRFTSSKPVLCYEQCVTLYWDVEGVNTVTLNGAGVVGHGSMQVCQPATFVLVLNCKDGTTKSASLSIPFNPQDPSCASKP